ncbi:MAG: hypothetical protein ACK4GN_05800, partial [Runella sp.]
KNNNISFDDEKNFEYKGFNKAIAGFGIIDFRENFFLANIDSDYLNDANFSIDGSKILSIIIKKKPKNNVLVHFKLNLPTRCQ